MARLCRYRPLAKSRGKWVGFPQVDSFGVKKLAINFIKKKRTKYKRTGLVPPAMKVEKICYR